MESFYEEALAAIQRAVEEQFEGNIARASRAWGVENDNLHKWLKRSRVPTLDKISPILAQICEYSFNKQPGCAIRRTGVNAPVEKIEGEDLASIPVMGHTGAGNAVELFSQIPDFWLPVLPQYFRRNVIGLVVDGDSMEPTIHKGAVVGIIPFDGNITEGGIYLVQIPPFGRTIKRIRMGGNGRIVLHSDNPLYEPVVIEPEGYEKIIAGKVIWFWQEC